jgi:hypothetical protein
MGFFLNVADRILRHRARCRTALFPPSIAGGSRRSSTSMKRGRCRLEDSAKDQCRVSHLSALAWRMAAQRSSISSSITWLIGAFSAVRSKAPDCFVYALPENRVW